VEGVALRTGRGRGAIVPGLFSDGAVFYLWSVLEGGAWYCTGAHGDPQVNLREHTVEGMLVWYTGEGVCAHWDGAVSFFGERGWNRFLYSAGSQDLQGTSAWFEMPGNDR
jgi:hypothetical protein